MTAIPTSDLRGHKQLHDRVCVALDRCQESEDIDFKESAPWDVLRWKIIRTALGMGNLRDGGIIIIGVSERNAQWEKAGIGNDHLSTFDVDTITDQLNAYISPYVEVDVVLVPDYDERAYLALYVHEFNDTPLVCKKNGPDGQDIKKAGVYVRPHGTPRTTIITDASQMHELLELAAEKRARRLLEVSHRIGMIKPSTADLRMAEEKKFDEELDF